ncbi:hypothetical protein F0562_008029 [Nyssa sinensis]|uniref:Uncharacterized protein n=1 Tax=Nyssa sinensis TaxID=561372 RepID=A0A5J5A8M4_9ASTE|nr:hypothetical protein F0562_008029 [Nyssa sinensis]
MMTRKTSGCAICGNSNLASICTACVNYRLWELSETFTTGGGPEKYNSNACTRSHHEWCADLLWRWCLGITEGIHAKGKKIFGKLQDNQREEVAESTSSSLKPKTPPRVLGVILCVN